MQAPQPTEARRFGTVGRSEALAPLEAGAAKEREGAHGAHDREGVSVDTNADAAGTGTGDD